jgi:hypothetical protein
MRRLAITWANDPSNAVVWIRSEGKSFFFSRKRSQKTFIREARGVAAANPQRTQVLWFYLSRKNKYYFHLRIAKHLGNSV